MRGKIDANQRRHRERQRAARLASVGLIYALGAFIIRANLPTTKTRLQLAIGISAILLLEAVHFFRKPFDPAFFVIKVMATIFGMVLAKLALEGTDVLWNGMVQLAAQMLDALGV